MALSPPQSALPMPTSFQAHIPHSSLPPGLVGRRLQTQTVEIVVGQDPGPEIFCPAIVCEGDTLSYHTNALCAWTLRLLVGGGQIVSLPINNDTIRVVWGSGVNGIGNDFIVCAQLQRPLRHAQPKDRPDCADSGQHQWPQYVGAGNVSQYTVPFIPGTNYQWSRDDSPPFRAKEAMRWKSYGNKTQWVANVQVTLSNSLANCEGEGLLPVQSPTLPSDWTWTGMRFDSRQPASLYRAALS